MCHTCDCVITRVITRVIPTLGGKECSGRPWGHWQACFRRPLDSIHSILTRSRSASGVLPCVVIKFTIRRRSNYFKCACSPLGNLYLLFVYLRPEGDELVVVQAKGAQRLAVARSPRALNRSLDPICITAIPESLRGNAQGLNQDELGSKIGGLNTNADVCHLIYSLKAQRSISSISGFFHS